MPFKLTALILLFFHTIAWGSNNDRLQLSVGIDLWPGYYPVILARQLGYFDEAGLSVNVVLPEATDNMLKDFQSQKLDLVCVAMGDAFALKKDAPNLKVIMITDESAGGDALMAKDPSLDTLKGKKIGTNLNGFGEIFLEAFLKTKGLTRNDVTLVHQEAAEAIHYLQDGRADVVHTWEPYVTEIISYHVGEIVFDSRQTPGLIPDALIANGHAIEKKSEALTRFIAAWQRAIAWWLDNRRKGDRIIEEELLFMPGSVNLEQVRLYNLSDNIAAFSQLGQKSLYPTAKIYLDYFKKKGVLDPRYKVSDFLDRQFLHQ